MKRSHDPGASMRRLRGICAKQAPVLLPAAAVVFVVTAIFATAAAAFAAACELVVVVLYLAWLSTPR